jgi:hypothetical protein
MNESTSDSMSQGTDKPLLALLEALNEPPKEDTSNQLYLNYLDRIIKDCPFLDQPAYPGAPYFTHIVPSRIKHPSLVRSIIRMLMINGAKPELFDENGNNALHVAILESNAEACRTLIDAGLDVNCPNSISSEMPLDMALHALRSPNRERTRELPMQVFRLLTMKRAVPGAYDASSERPYCMLSACGSAPGAWKEDLWEAVSLLLKAGAKLDCVEPVTGKQPLHVACENGYWMTCKVLIQEGADIDVADAQGMTPPAYADRFGSKSHELRAVIRAAQMKKLLEQMGSTAAPSA